MAQSPQQMTEAQERRREDLEWRNKIREEDVAWRQAARRAEVEIRDRTRVEESRVATRRAALLAAAQCLKPGTPIPDITHLADHFIAWIGEVQVD